MVKTYTFSIVLSGCVPCLLVPSDIRRAAEQVNGVMIPRGRGYTKVVSRSDLIFRRGAPSFFRSILSLLLDSTIEESFWVSNQPFQDHYYGYPL